MSKREKKSERRIVTHIYSHVSFAHFNAFTQKDSRLFIWLLVCEEPPHNCLFTGACAFPHSHIFKRLDLFHFYAMVANALKISSIYSSFKQYFTIHTHCVVVYGHIPFSFFSSYRPGYEHNIVCETPTNLLHKWLAAITVKGYLFIICLI